MDVTKKRLIIYVIGLFLLALGVSFSIQAALGVSPLAYAFSLTTGYSVGIMSIVANILFIILQAILIKVVDLKMFGTQLIITFLFGFFIDAALYLVQLFPTPEGLVIRWVLLVISLFVIAIGLLGYFVAKFPLMPYDALTYAISTRFKLKFTKAKITSDLINVGIAGLVCIIFIHTLGSIGMGTIVAAYFIGKILGIIMTHFEQPLQTWLDKTNEVKQEEARSDKEVVEAQN